jgi:hypothetical protein
MEVLHCLGKSSAFGNVPHVQFGKKPLRDNDLADSIQVIS